MALMVRTNRWIPVPLRSRKHRNPIPSSPNPGDLCNRPETYRTMGVNGTPVRHLSDLSKVPGRILDRKMVKTFRLDICLVEEQFEMVQYVEKGRKPRWGYFPKEGHRRR